MQPAQEAIKKKSFRSLSVILTASFLALSLGIIIITNAVQLVLNFQTQQNAIFNNQQQIADEAANQVKDFIQAKISILETTVKINTLATASEKDQKIVLERLLSFNPTFRQVAVFNKEAKQLGVVSRLSGFMQGVLAEQFNSENISGKNRQKLWISDVYVDKTTSEPMVAIAVPILSVFGDFQGNLVAEINLKFMWDLVGGIKVGNGGFVYVVDKKGQLLAFKDISRVLKGENLSKLQEISEFIKEGSDVDSNTNAGITKGINNIYVVSAFVSLGVPDWAIVAEIPVVEGYQKVIQGLIVSSLIIFLGIAIAVVLSLYLIKRITKPIKKLRDAAEEVRSGKLGVSIEINSNDEIGELASVFNKMTSELRQSYENLEEKIEERTKTLDQKLAELEKFQKLTVDRELKMIELKKELALFKKKGK
jgi:methyl-accepting chemotaxis protein